MFGSGFFEIGFLLFIAYLLFGPKKLPEIARTLGKGMAELKRASNELKRSLEEEVSNLDRYSEHHDQGASGTTPTYGNDHPDPPHTEPESRP